MLTINREIDMNERAQIPQSADDFMIYNSKWVDWALSPIKRIYYNLYLRLPRMGALGRLAAYEQFLFFVIAVAAIFLLTPRYIVIAKYLIEKYLFQKGPEPRVPSARCGTDPTTDGLSCERFAPCGPW